MERTHTKRFWKLAALSTPASRILASILVLGLVSAGTARRALGLPEGAWSAEGNQTQAQYGASVATAGDVNGDGYSDFLVGAPLMNDGIEDQGKVFLYHGSAGGLGATSWTAVGLSFEAEFGRSAASAGDVNGDGFDDVIVGSPRDEVSVTNEGRVFLYLGSPAGLTAFSWSAASGNSGSSFGWKVAPAGDVNGDGYADFLVGAPNFHNAFTGAGKAYLYQGAANGTPVLAWTYEGDEFAEYCGYDVATAGDVNADGYDDVIVGAFGDDRCYVFHGGAGGLSVAPNNTISSAVGSQFGFSVSTAGDVNGDGYADVLVGWPHWGGSEQGRAIVYLGSAGGVTASTWNYQNPQAGARFGHDAECAGDVNGDGYSDIVIGAQQGGTSAEGQSFLFYGSPQGPMDQALWVAVGAQASAQFGDALGTAGDVNGDGYSDIAVAAKLFDDPDISEGRVAVWHGSSDAPGKVLDWRGEENQELAEYGHALALGDFNGDGYADIVAGTGKWDGIAGADCGKVWAYYGRDSAPPTTADWTEEGTAASQRFGDAVACALDVDNDGYDDLLVGAPLQGGRGAAHLYRGSAGGLEPAPSWSTYGVSAGEQYGFSVSRAGDVNGDGYADVIIGAPSYTGSRPQEGRAHVFHGSASGLGATAAWTVTGGQTGAQLGFAVCTAGDVNADGYSDVLVGAPLYDAPEQDEGIARVYVGSSSGVRTDPVWTGDSDQAGAQFGFSVTTSGDVNGDAHSDVAVGAPFFDAGNADAGKVSVYAGEPAGVGAVAFKDIVASQGSFGWALASADLDDDGLSDLIAGAPFVDNGQLDEGQVYAFPGPLSTATTWFANDGNTPLAWHGMSLASGGDVTGDGFPDIVAGAPGLENPHVHEGVVNLWYGNGMWETYGFPVPIVHGLDRRPRILVDDGTAPVALLGRADPSVLFKAHGRTPLGRGRVSMEVEVKRFGTPFNGLGTVLSGATDTGPVVLGDGSFVELSQLLSHLTDGTLYRWRLRIVSDHPYWKHSPWFTAHGNGAAEMDFRVGQTPADVADGVTGSKVSDLLVHPSPLSSTGVVSFHMAAAEPVTLAIYDAGGRLVRSLLDEVRGPGDHQIAWDGSDPSGRRLPSGIYFAVLATRAEMRVARAVIAR
jgi:hypothetical protein